MKMLQVFVTKLVVSLKILTQVILLLSDCQAEEATCQKLIDIYLSSCKKNVTEPIQNIVEQLKVFHLWDYKHTIYFTRTDLTWLQTLDLSDPHAANLTLRGLTLGPHDCESLEDVLKRVPLKLLDLGASHRSDDVLDCTNICCTFLPLFNLPPSLQGLIALFDMIEYYEAASHVSFAAQKNMTTRGWQACCRMIKRVNINHQVRYINSNVSFFCFGCRLNGWSGWMLPR